MFKLSVFEKSVFPLLVNCLYLSTSEIRIEMNDSQQVESVNEWN